MEASQQLNLLALKLMSKGKPGKDGRETEDCRPENGEHKEAGMLRRCFASNRRKANPALLPACLTANSQQPPPIQ